MNLRRRHRITSEVSTSSLNDIMFFLLLFFLIMSTLVNPNIIKLNLPKANTQGVTPHNIVVSIDKTRTFFVNRVQTNPDHLVDALKGILSPNDQRIIIVAADETVPIGDIVKVMVAGKVVNAKVMLATQKEK
jgi:biopolymer transport protein ExbD